MKYEMTTYPFAVPEFLHRRLPEPSKDGNCYVDVLVSGRWDGILVINAAGMCIGIYVRRRVLEYPLYFTADKIEDIRPASFKNRLLASVPFDLWNGAMLAILVLSPIGLLLGSFISPFFALFSVVACALAVYMMYQGGSGFPFIRPFLAILGLMQIMLGGARLLRWLLLHLRS